LAVAGVDGASRSFSDIKEGGMVAMGEYSEACICQVRGKQASLTPAVLGAVAAVDTAARVQQQNAAAAATMK
jgi:hypothetical protein